MKPTGFALADLVTHNKGEGQWKWYKSIDVNGAYKQGRCEKIWFKACV